MFISFNIISQFWLFPLKIAWYKLTIMSYKVRIARYIKTFYKKKFLKYFFPLKIGHYNSQLRIYDFFFQNCKKKKQNY